MKRRGFTLKRYANQGFTLIELLLVVAIVSALAVTVFVALNPAQRLRDSHNARRTADVDAILSAIHTSIVDNNGNLPSKMPAAGTEAQLGSAASGCAINIGTCGAAGVACADLLTTTGSTYNLSKYLKSMPVEPLGGATYDATKTGYTVVVDTNGIITVKACAVELPLTVLSASR